ncbi:hypothetical protein BSNK01_13100 [Bacillaceae bacterium]
MIAYIVKKGDTMYKIAKKYGVSLNALIRANPHIPNPSLIFPGQIVYIPLKKDHPKYPKTIKCVIPYMPDYLLHCYTPYYQQMMVPRMQTPYLYSEPGTVPQMLPYGTHPLPSGGYLPFMDSLETSSEVYAQESSAMG